MSHIENLISKNSAIEARKLFLQLLQGINSTVTTK